VTKQKIHFKKNKNTRNVWQSLAYSPPGVVVSPLVNTYEIYPQLLITAVPNGPQANVADLSEVKQEGLAVASIARDDPSTLPGNDPFPRARMHHDCNAR